MFQKTKSYKSFVFVNLKNRVSAKNNDKISVTRSFLDPIKNRVSVKSVYVEAVYLEVLLYWLFTANLWSFDIHNTPERILVLV